MKEKAICARKRSFTLTELLITVVFIAILAGILPAVLYAQQPKENSVKCLDNLRRLGQVTLTYANNNSGWLPGPTEPRMFGKNTKAPYIWVISLYQNKLTSGTNQFDCEFLRCPGGDTNSELSGESNVLGSCWRYRTGTTGGKVGSDYTANYYVDWEGGTRADGYRNITGCKYPSATAVYMEGISFCASNIKNLRFRHADASNTVFQDGSAAPVQKWLVEARKLNASLR